MSYAKDDYSGITPMIALNKSVTVDGGLIAKSLAIGGEKNRLVVREDGVYVGCPCKFDDEGEPMKEEQLRYYSLHSVIESIQELNRRTAWIANDMGVSESIALTDQLGVDNVNTYHSNTKDLLPGLRNLKDIEEVPINILRLGTLDKPFSENSEWIDGAWTYTFITSREEGSGTVTFSVKINDTSITDDVYIAPYGTIIDSTGKTAILTSMNNMFYECRSLQSLDVSGWDTSKVTDMSNTFRNCPGLTSLDVSNWDTGKVTDMNSMFRYCPGLTSLDVSNWNTSSVTNMSNTFRYCPGLTSLDVSNWETSKVTDMSEMFKDCSSLTSLDVSNWDTGNVTNMYAMFDQCGLTSLDVSNWDTGKVTNMNTMFGFCYKLVSLDLSSWDVSSVTQMNSMFLRSYEIKSLNLSGWDTFKVTDMGHMFNGCEKIETINLTGWNSSNVTNMSNVFQNCPRLKKITISQTGVSMLVALLEVSSGWVIENTTTPMDTVKDSTDWLADFGSTTLTFTRTV